MAEGRSAFASPFVSGQHDNFKGETAVPPPGAIASFADFGFLIFLLEAF